MLKITHNLHGPCANALFMGKEMFDIDHFKQPLRTRVSHVAYIKTYWYNNTILTPVCGQGIIKAYR